MTITVSGRRVDLETGEILAEGEPPLLPARLCGAPVYGQSEDCGYVLTNAGSCPRHGRRKTGKD